MKCKQFLGGLVIRYRKQNRKYNNVEKLNELQQQGLNLNYRTQVNQIKVEEIKKGNQDLKNLLVIIHNWKIHVQHNQIHFEPLEDLYNNLETQEQNNSDNYKELIESISQIISIKRELVQFNIKESSSNSPRQCDIEKVDPTLISGAFRFKTHHNLGEKLMRLRQISKQENDFRAFSELNDDDEVLQQSSEEDDNLPEQISHKQPWYIRSAIPIMSCKNSEKKQEVYSERKKHTKNKNSFASITSYTSFNKFGVTTLRDEFLNIYQNQQFDEYIKEKDTEMNDSDEIPQLIQQESIIEDSTIIIDRKQQQLSKSKIHIEIIQESVKYEPFRNLQIAGILLATCGIAGWLYKKYF